MSRMTRTGSSVLTAAVLALLGFAGAADLSAQGVTTAAVLGTVTDEAGQPLNGVQITVTNQSTGGVRQALTREDGRYVVSGLRPGGPYVIAAEMIGFAEAQVEGFELGLGQTRQVNLTLRTEAVALGEIRVAGQSRNNTGVQTTVDEQTINRAPALNREIVDLARLTPQAFVANEDDDGAAISIAGQNNEYNSLYIDGVVNNDVFGLSAQGTNGGQTGAPPISFDAIEQMYIAISPFDVTQGGFTGGAINAITRSGTNRFEGSVYGQFRNDVLAGESDWLADDGIDATQPEPLPEFQNGRFGFRLGGPIMENKLFFFVNAEILRSETPAPFVGLETYEGDATAAQLSELRQTLIDEVGYDPGDFGDKVSSLDDSKFLLKLDWAISDDHRLTARHSYSHSDNIDAFASDADDINYSNTAEVFPNTTNSTAIELNSTFNSQLSNRLLIGATFVRDDRDFAGDPFPYVVIDDGQGDIQLGSERFSTGNILNQDIISVTNNLQYVMGDHTFTLGTHNEFYDIGNLFLRENFGYYQYSSLDDFLQSVRAINDPTITPAEPDNFNRGFSLVDQIAGDESEAIGAFKAYQLGFYLQDQWRPSDRLTVTGGLRLDIPNISTDPRTNDQVVSLVNDQIAPEWDLMGAQPGKAPGAQLYFAPRLGVTYDLTGDGTTQIRGGVGVFTGRVPFVYPGAMYLNNGVTAGYVSARATLPDGSPIPLVTDPSQYLDAGDFGQDVVPSGEIDLFADDFRYPRVARTSLGVDHILPWDIQATIEGQYTKNLDNILVRNVNMDPNALTPLDGPDNRLVYAACSPFCFTVDRSRNDTDLGSNRGFNNFANRLQGEVGEILLVSNYSEGYTYDVSVSLAKVFGESTTGSIAYTYGDAYSVNDATSDQIWSVYRFNENVNGLNNLDMARSDFSIGHRWIGQLSHRQEWLDNLGTMISAVFTAESGRPFSWIIGNNFTFTGEGSGTSPLVYIPGEGESLVFADILNNDGSVNVAAAEQQQAFNAFVDSNDYLSSRRGNYAERNGDRAPMEYVVDLRLAQEVFTNVAGRRNTVELTLDIFNFTNLLNSNWGRRYNAGFRTINLLRFEGFMDPAADDLTPVYTYRFDDESLDEYWDDRILDFGSYGSRWLMQLGARYSF